MEIVNLSAEELFTSAYVDVLHSDTYSYRETYNLIVDNKSPRAEDYVLRSLWISNIKNEQYEEKRNYEASEIIVSVLNNTNSAKAGKILTRFVGPKNGYIEVAISPELKTDVLKELREGVFYKTDIREK